METGIFQILSAIIGAIVVLAVFYANFRKEIKARFISFIAEKIYRQCDNAEILSANLFMVITSGLLAFGLLAVIVFFLN